MVELMKSFSQLHLYFVKAAVPGRFIETLSLQVGVIGQLRAFEVWIAAHSVPEAVELCKLNYPIEVHKELVVQDVEYKGEVIAQGE
jgi:hypothetical protein